MEVEKWPRNLEKGCEGWHIRLIILCPLAGPYLGPGPLGT